MLRKQAKHSYKRLTALLLVLCLVLSSINSGLLVAYALAAETEYQIGTDVTAILHDNGVLQLSGSGDTYDYSADDDNRTPFYMERESITSVEIADGITSIGDFLFYNCKNLTGALTIPGSVIRIGEQAFSGDDADSAPSFQSIYSEFVATDIVADGERSESPFLPDETPASDSTDTTAAPDASDQNQLPADTDNEIPDIAPESPTEPSKEPADEPDVASDHTADTTTPVNIEPPAAQESIFPVNDTPSVADETDTPVGQEQTALSEQSTGGAVSLESIPTDTNNLTSAPQTSEPSYELANICEQEIGAEIFFPGQLGVFKLSEQKNESFRIAAEWAGYAEVSGYVSVSFYAESDSPRSVSVPVTEKGMFLPDFPDTGLAWPDESHNSYTFLGWTERAIDAGVEPADVEITADTGTVLAEQTELSAGESAATVLSAYTFYSGDAESFTAAFHITARTMKEQTLSADVNEQRVSVSGNLPVEACVSAELVPVETAAKLAGDYIPDASMVVLALDITILVEGVKYQPNEYGESVSVSISNIDAAPADGQSLSVLHIDESAAVPGEAVQVIETDSVTSDAVAFTADSFSVYIITMAQNHTLTFGNGNYSVTREDGSAFTDGDGQTDGVQITTNGAFFRFKIVPNSGCAVTGVSTAAVDAGGSSAVLYGPYDGVYTVAGVTANQIVTVTTAAARTVTYHNNKSPATTAEKSYPAGPFTPALPADLGFSANSGFHFVAWNTASDGSGTSYPAETAAAISTDTHVPRAGRTRAYHRPSDF